jgi:DnaK suppressor protein
MHDKNSYRATLDTHRASARKEVLSALQRIDADRYAALTDQVHDTKDQAIAQLLVESDDAGLKRAMAELQDIDAALQRLDAGAYGRCVACGVDIPTARLTAFPTAKRCLSCQSQHEQKNSARKPT